MMRPLPGALLLLLFVANRAGAQDYTPDVILTCKAHQAWMDSLNKAPLAQQIQMIKDRVVSDTIVYVNNTGKASIIPNREQGCCKPFIILSGYAVKFDEHHPAPDLQLFMTVIGQIRIDTVFILRSQELTSLYGSASNCGVIMINTKDKQSERIIKQAYRHQH
jgi:hypothetical protein